MFGTKKTNAPADLAKQQKRALRRNGRELDRERRNLQREEQKIIQQIKREAKRDPKSPAVTILAKELVQNRNAQKRMLVSKSKISSVSHKMTTAASTMKMASAMKGATQVMASVNSQMDPARFSQMMQQFAMQNEKMDMASEMMDDLMDEFDGDMEDEVDEITKGVLDELAIDTTAMMPVVTPSKGPEIAAAKRTTYKTGDKQTDMLLDSLGIQ